MAPKKQKLSIAIEPITAEEIEVIRQRVGATLQDNECLARKFDAMLKDWVAAQKAAADKDSKLSNLRLLLLRAMGILPSSEKQNSPEPKSPRSKKGKNPQSPEEKLTQDLEKARQRSKYYKGLARSIARKLKKIRDRRRQKKPEDDMNFENKDYEYNPADIVNEPMTPEEEAQDKAETEDLERCMKLGSGHDPKFDSASAQLMARGISEAKVVERDLLVNVNDIPEGAVQIGEFKEVRRRYDCLIQVTALDFSVEKLILMVNGERQIITADLSKIGPPKMKVTWGFLAQLDILATQYALPFNRIALMLSTQEKTFTSSEICRYFAYIAERFLPLYLYYFKQLANVSYLSGDDTDSLVLEVERGLALTGKGRDDQPWSIYRTVEIASATLEKIRTKETEKDKDKDKDESKVEKELRKDPTLALLTAEEMGFESTRAGSKEPIKEFKTTLLKGRLDESDPKSLVVFYRSHLGGLGNLLDALLQARSAKAPTVLHLQTDLSPVNLALSPESKSRFKIIQYGCLSHVRRPFKQYRHENPMFCDAILASIAQVFLNERMLSLHGRNSENILAVRQRHSLPAINLVEELCDMLKDLYPKAHPLGKGARYVLNHEKEIKAFINNPLISPSNDESEQMVRMESLVAANSHFRQCIEGRVQFDICRTIGQTAISAGCHVTAYTEWYLRQDPKAIQANPSDFTPLAYRKMLERGASDQASITPSPPGSHNPPRAPA